MNRYARARLAAPPLRACAFGLALMTVSLLAHGKGTEVSGQAASTGSPVPKNISVSQTQLDKAAGEAKREKVDVVTHPREGDPADAILDVAEENDADLVLVGNKGMTGARRFLLGSVPNKISHHAPCDVWIVKTT